MSSEHLFTRYFKFLSFLTLWFGRRCFRRTERLPIFLLSAALIHTIDFSEIRFVFLVKVVNA